VPAVKSTYDPDYRRMLARLRQAREEAGLLQREVGRQLGRPQSFVSKVESGERRLDPIELVRFATLYGKPLAWFVQTGGSTQ
jgi:transcriptional regulator with XRE-family HTH domain